MADDCTQHLFSIQLWYFDTIGKSSTMFQFQQDMFCRTFLFCSIVCTFQVQTLLNNADNFFNPVSLHYREDSLYISYNKQLIRRQNNFLVYVYNYVIH